jgi:hypothetical protein
MARGRLYKASTFDTATYTATGGTNAGTTALPVLYGVTTSTAPLDISNISVGVMGVGTIPSNASVAWFLAVVTGTVAGGTAAVARQQSGVALAANTTFLTAGGSGAAAITGLTAGNVLWDRVTPFAAGANWEDIYTYGDEINVPISTKFALYCQPTSAGTSTTFFAEIEFTE